MTRLAVALVVVLLSTESYAQEQRRKDDRVRAKDPTVVTVEGQADIVRTTEPRDSGNIGTKVVRGLRSGVVNTGRAIGRFGGWLLNTDDDIPSRREREAEQRRKQEQ